MSTVVDEKDPDVSAEYFVDFHDAIVQEAERRAYFAAGVFLYFPRDTGFYYEVTTAGKLGAHYPYELPRAAGETVNDGSAVLTCRHPDVATIPEVSSVDWTVPTGITEASSRVDGSRAYITLSGGTDGVDYDVLCRMTPTTGNIVEQTITVPVRAQ